MVTCKLIQSGSKHGKLQEEMCLGRSDVESVARQYWSYHVHGLDFLNLVRPSHTCIHRQHLHGGL